MRLVQLRGSGGRLALHATDRALGEGLQTGDGSWYHAATAAMREALADPGFVGRDAITCMPSRQTRYRHLRLAPMPDGELPTAVQWRAAKELDWGVEQMCADYFDVGEAMEAGKPRREVIAVAALGQHVEAHAAMMQTAGLRLRAIDAEAAAIARCLSRAPAPPPQPAEDDPGGRAGEGNSAWFVIVLGTDDSALMVVRDGQPRFVRPITTGRRAIVAEAAERAGLCREDHALLWQLMDGEAAASDEPTIVAQAQEGLRATCDRLADELEHAVRLCVHYLSQARLTDLVPQVGCIVGAGQQETALLSGLNGACKIAFQPLRQALGPSVRSLVDHLPAPATLDPWLLPIGLALYGREHVIEEAAA